MWSHSRRRILSQKSPLRQGVLSRTRNETEVKFSCWILSRDDRRNLLKTATILSHKSFNNHTSHAGWSCVANLVGLVSYKDTRPAASCAIVSTIYQNRWILDLRNSNYHNQVDQVWIHLENPSIDLAISWCWLACLYAEEHDSTLARVAYVFFGKLCNCKTWHLPLHPTTLRGSLRSLEAIVNFLFGDFTKTACSLESRSRSTICCFEV